MPSTEPSTPERRPIVLIGPMAAGKSSIGRQLARALDAPFVDTDRSVTAANGPIAEIFAVHGEPHFRALERDAVATALGDGAVVSVGGGAVLDPATRAALGDATILLLTVSQEAVARRIGSSTRPLLTGGMTDWVRIRNERMPVYESLAHATFDTSTRSITHVVDDIVAWLEGSHDRQHP